MSIHKGWALLLLLSGCVVVPSLIPTGPSVESGTRRLAYAEAVGVQLWADATWRGDPIRLAEYVTPLSLTLVNKSGHTLRLAYEDFELLGASGTHYAALPPFAMSGRSERSVEPAGYVLADYHPAVPVHRPHPPPPFIPRVHVRRYWVAPHHSTFYVGVPLWSAWAWNTAYYSRHYASWPRTLPTQDMLQFALPEGALDDGGDVNGFVYFQNVNRERAVKLSVALRDATTNELLGTLVAPFGL
jgi:hypothetical protein